MENTIPGRPAWATGPLNLYLIDIFPTYLTKLGALDIHAIRAPLGKSHECVYQWLRKSALRPENAAALCELANRPDNVAHLKKLGRKPPKIEDFLRFLGLGIA